MLVSRSLSIERDFCDKNPINNGREQRVMLRCIILVNVRLLIRSYAMQFGELREVGESYKFL